MKIIMKNIKFNIMGNEGIRKIRIKTKRFGKIDYTNECLVLTLNVLNVH
jgi:hypothetical protein